VRNRQAGVSLIELVLAITISTFLAIGAARVYVSFTKNTAQQKRNMQFQQEMTTAAKIMEDDLRMMGYGLPGNGLEVSMTGQRIDSVHVFKNEKDYETTLTADASSGSTTLSVLSIAGAEVDGWVCINVGSDALYRRITAKTGTTGSWQISLATALPAGTYTVAATKIFYTPRVTYFVDRSTTPNRLVRRENTRPFYISSTVDSLKVLAMNVSDSLLTSNFGTARTMTLVMSGGGGANRAGVRADSVSAVIRNYM